MADLQQLMQRYNALKARNDDATADANSDAELDSPVYDQIIQGQNKPGVMGTGIIAEDPNKGMSQFIPGYVNPSGPGMTQFLPDRSTSVPLRDPMARTTTPQESADADMASYEQAMKSPNADMGKQPKGPLRKVDLGNGMSSYTTDLLNAPSESSQAVSRLAAVKDEEAPEEAPKKEMAGGALEKETEVDKEIKSPSAENKKPFTLNELKAKQNAARQSASVMAGQMQAAASASTITGRPADISGFKAQMALDLSEASDYEKLIGEQRNEQIADMKQKASEIDNEKALMDIGTAKEEHDSESDISIAAQGVMATLAARLGMEPEQFEGLPYSAIKQLSPGIDKIIQAQLRADAMKESNAQRQANLQERRDTQQEHQDDLMQKSVVEKINPLIASSRLGLGRAKAVSMAADRIKAYLADYKGDLSKLNNIDQVELAKAVDTMLSGGTGTVTGTAKLIPHTLLGNIRGIQQFIFGKPVGTDQQEFVKRFLSAANAEQENAEKQITKFHKQYKTGLEGTGFYGRRKQFIDNYLDSMTTMAANDYTSGAPKGPANPNEEKRQTKDGRTAVFDKTSKQFLRFE